MNDLVTGVVMWPAQRWASQALPLGLATPGPVLRGLVTLPATSGRPP